MGNRYEGNRPYYWQESTLFDDCWLVVRRDDTKILADVDSKKCAKRLAKELNQLVSIIESLGVEIKMVRDDQ